MRIDVDSDLRTIHPGTTAISIYCPFKLLNRVLLAAVLVAPQLSAQVFYPKRVLSSASAGYLESRVKGDWFRGSGVIARDPKLVYSCCHLFYENGVWATEYKFYPAFDGRELPESGAGISPRGFHYFRNYSENADVYRGDSEMAFAYDFTVLYGLEPFGPAVGWWRNGSAALGSSRFKRIVGYPEDIEFTGASGFTFQHATDWFRNRAWRTYGDYHSFNGVSTGGGTSGGPVFVQDDAANELLAGILVSGSATTAGVYALNDSSNSMASAALGLPKITRTFGNNEAVLLPDAGRTPVVRETTTSGFAENIMELKFSVAIATSRRGDLSVWLRSPGGRIRWISKPSASNARNLMIHNEVLTSNFRGDDSNGLWQLRMRDAKVKNRATFRNFSLVVTAIGE
jgi:hypothetical protein